jgi:hypothetical protein
MNTALLLLKNTVCQFGFFFGILIAGGGLLTLISRSTNQAFQQSRFPNFGLYFFGFIGVPVHEFCHALFCKLFFHEVKKVKWFDPKAKGGANGYVMHSFNPWNPYHRIGHFFIGMGPVLLAPLILGGLFYFLVPSGRGLFHADFLSTGTIKPMTLGLLHAIFRRSTFSSPGFYVFLYLSLCITSQMELSKEDMKQAVLGIVPLVVLLALINAAAWIFHFSWHYRAVQYGTLGLTAGACVFTFAALLSTANLVLVKGACLLFANESASNAPAVKSRRAPIAR